jgi:diguanylate cyclase (GGDEF)-like protein/PAS domain S-box-containing protein
MHAAAKRPKRLIRLPLILNTGWALLAVATIGVAAALYQLRSDALEEARRDVANLALVLGEHTTRAVQGIDLVLRDVQDTIAAFDLVSPETFDRLIGSERMHRELKEKIARLPHLDVFSILNAQGRLINVSRPAPLGLDLSDRDFFRHFRDNNDPHLFVSRPIENRTTGTLTIYLVRRINSASGEFLGVVLGGVPIRYFNDLYSKFDLPRGESFTLARRDGMVLARYPRQAPQTGQMIPAGTPWHDVVARGGGQFSTPGDFDGIARRVAVQPLPEFPLVVSAAVGDVEALAVWRRQAWSIGVGALLVFAYAALLIHVLRKQFIRLRQSRTTLREQNESLTRVSGELAASEMELTERTREAELILETMDQGLMMVDRDGVVVQCNSRARALLDLPADLVAARPTFKVLLTYQWDMNKSGHDEGTFEEFIQRRSVVDQPNTRELRRPDGRVIEVRGTPVYGGGFVRTYTDITERKSAEDKVQYLAHHDDLTRLPNRAAFRERLHNAIAMSRAGRRGTTLLYLDLDGFKLVNDTRGHDVGDLVLVEAAERMQACVRAVDTVARVGGDEFAIVLPFLSDRQAISDVASRIVASLARPFVIRGSSATIGASIGIATHPEDAATLDALLKSADEALYEAKRAGKNTYRFSLAAVRQPAPSRAV